MKDFDKEIEKLNKEKDELIALKKPIEDKLSKVYKKLKKVHEEKENYTLSLPKTKEEEVEYFLFEDGFVSGERYKARNKFWQAKGFSSSGYYHEIKQVALKVMLYKGEQDNLEQTISAVEEILPFLKEIEGAKRLGIFEHTLSENGVWSLEVKDGEVDLILHRYHHRSVNKTFKNIREALAYVQENHYYESGVDGED